jgi:ABC-2 type transport system permease protein
MVVFAALTLVGSYEKLAAAGLTGFPAALLSLVIAAAVMFVLAWLISFGWRFLANLSAFWSPNARGIIRFVFSLSWFASGFLFPLRYFPEWLQRLCAVTPFAYTINAITEVFLGLRQGADVLRLLAVQMAWAAALVLAGAVVLRAGVRRLVILGG